VREPEETGDGQGRKAGKSEEGDSLKLFSMARLKRGGALGKSVAGLIVISFVVLSLTVLQLPGAGMPQHSSRFQCEGTPPDSPPRNFQDMAFT
jgi:hypothetical protein